MIGSVSILRSIPQLTASFRDYYASASIVTRLASASTQMPEAYLRIEKAQMSIVDERKATLNQRALLAAGCGRP